MSGVALHAAQKRSEKKEQQRKDAHASAMCPFDDSIKRDDDGFPTMARRRLKKLTDGNVQDIDDEQIFEPIKQNDGVRLRPVFGKHNNWKNKDGFRAVKLMLDCAGSRGQYTLVDGTGVQMDYVEWAKQCTGITFKPEIKCLTCGQTCKTTTIAYMRQSQRVCCGCAPIRQLWVDRRDDFILLLDEKGLELVTSEWEWKQQCTSNLFKPEIRCLSCGQARKTTSICSIQQGHGFSCCAVLVRWVDRRWIDRRDDFSLLLDQKGLELVTSEEEWKQQCTGYLFKPEIKCLSCGQTCKTTAIHSIQGGQGVGCSCVARLQLWVDRRDDFSLLLDKKGLELVTSEEEWKQQCTGNLFKPEIKCLSCGQTCKTTVIASIQQGLGIGCACINKTESKLFSWLQKHFPDVFRHNVLKLKNPSTGGTMSVDFDSPSLRFAVELDGNIAGGHFDPDPTNGCPARDLEKEKQLYQRGIQVVRVLQEDVWTDKNGWENWLLNEIKRWRRRRSDGLEVENARHPDAPEYLGGIYASLRAS